VTEFVKTKAHFAARWFETRGWKAVFDAEELFHEAMIYVLRAADTYGDAATETLLKAAGHHRIIDVTRKERVWQARSVKSADEALGWIPAYDPPSESEVEEDRQRVYDLVGVLEASLKPYMKRIVMEFIYPSEHTRELMGAREAPRVCDVAKSLRVNKGTVSESLRTARELLIESGVQVESSRRVTRKKKDIRIRRRSRRKNPRRKLRAAGTL